MTANHGYCQSLYITDPNGLLLEFTVDHPDVDASTTSAGTAHIRISLGGYLATTRVTTNGVRRPDSQRTEVSPGTYLIQEVQHALGQPPSIRSATFGHKGAATT